jgi:hypothetical protein
MCAHFTHAYRSLFHEYSAAMDIHALLCEEGVEAHCSESRLLPVHVALQQALLRVKVAMFTGRIAMQVSRRMMIAASLFFCGCGCLLMMDVGDEPINLARYLASLSTILAFTNILEGVTMSVMGDVIHPVMAAGFWNAGMHLLSSTCCSATACFILNLPCCCHIP